MRKITLSRILLGSIWLIVGITLLIAITLGAFLWRANLYETQQANVAAPKSGRFMNAGDVEIFIQETGPATGPVVLFIHGTGAWSETWRTSIDLLGAQGYHAVALDLPPFGYSQRPLTANYSKVSQARRIIAVLDALQAQTAILVGHSFGGGPTLDAALLAPARIKGLILVDAALNIHNNETDARNSPIVQGLLRVTPLRDAMVATFLTNPMFTKHLLQAFIDNPANATQERIAIYQQPLIVQGSTHNIGEWLPQLLVPTERSPSETPTVYGALTMPVVAVWGARDTITPLEQGVRFVSLVKGARLEVIPDVGHIPQLENTAAFNQLLLGIIKNL